MVSAVENSPELLERARKRAETLLAQYVTTVGSAIGQEYEVRFSGSE